MASATFLRLCSIIAVAPDLLAATISSLTFANWALSFLVVRLLPALDSSSLCANCNNGSMKPLLLSDLVSNWANLLSLITASVDLSIRSLSFVSLLLNLSCSGVRFNSLRSRRSLRPLKVFSNSRRSLAGMCKTRSSF